MPARIKWIFHGISIDNKPIIPRATAAGFPIINVKIVGAVQCPFQFIYLQSSGISTPG
tara:strand:- start:513 stop:686 length:174 start_codon:yes stop_codon:yes gene_type:complete